MDMRQKASQDSIKDIFEDFEKEDIFEMAKEKGVKGIRGLSKSKLIEKVTEYMLIPEVVEKYFLCMSDKDIEEFEKALVTEGLYYLKNHRSMICLYEGGYLGVLPNGSIMIPKEVEEVYNTFKGTDFDEKRKKISYFTQCLSTAKLLYGIVTIDIFMKLINVNTDISMTEEEVREEIKNIPVEFADYLLIRDKIYSKELWPDDRGLLLAQGSKEYYIPTLSEIMDIGLLGYLPDSNEMRKLKKFILNKLEAMEDEADFACSIIQNIIREEGEISNIFNMLEELGLCFENERQIEEFIKLINGVWNNTRMIVNRGFKTD